MTKFSFEVPFNYLDYFDKYQDFIFTLSLHFEEPRFVKYVRRKLQQGLKTIWLDNSFNEVGEATDIMDLQRLFYTHECHKVFMPDDVKWSVPQIVRSYEESIRWMPESCVIGIVNSDKAYKALSSLGCWHFAVPYRVRDQISPEIMTQMKPDLHFLGLNNIPELIKYRPSSVDTSMPIKLAMVGMTIRDWEAEEYRHIHTSELGHQGESFFNADMDPKQMKLSVDNINTIKEAIR